MIQSCIRIGTPEPAGLYLGCRHVIRDGPSPTTGFTVRMMEYDMSDFLRACVTRYTELTGISTFRHAATPFSEIPDSGAATVGRVIPEGYGEESFDGSAGVPSAAAGRAGVPSASVPNSGKFGAIASRV